jgi:hypothetical protein
MKEFFIMNVLLALAVVSCQHYFNFEKCVNDTMSCVEIALNHKPLFPRIPVDLEVTDLEIKMANSFLKCAPINPYEN